MDFLLEAKEKEALFLAEGGAKGLHQSLEDSSSLLITVLLFVSLAS